MPFKKGCIPWNKGKTDVYSEETRQNISESGKKVWANRTKEESKKHLKPWMEAGQKACRTLEARQKAGKARSE